MMKLFTVAHKELRDSSRDRRTLFNSLLMGPILGPLIFVAMMSFITSKEVEKAQATIELPVVNQSLAPNLVDHLKQQGVVILDGPDNPEQAVMDELHDVVLRIPEQYPEQWRNGVPAVLDLIADTSKRETGTTQQRVRLLLEGYGSQIGSLRMSLRGVDPKLIRAVHVKNVDLSTPESRGALILAMLPYFIMITVFISGMSIAIDTTAGEKERLSLEPLLINPVPRWQIMAGKLVATTLFTLVSLALALIAFVFSIDFIPASKLNFELNFDWAMAARFFLLTAPIGVISAALLTVLAAFAKSFREAQSYMGLVVLIPMFPSLWLFINPVKAEQWMMWIPLLSQNVLINQYIRGESVPWSWDLITIFSSLLFGLLLTVIAATLYNRPKLIFSS